MVKNHARKAATRARATSTGEPYMQARGVTTSHPAGSGGSDQVAVETPGIEESGSAPTQGLPTVGLGRTSGGDVVYAELTADIRILVPQLFATPRRMDSSALALEPFIAEALERPHKLAMSIIDADQMTTTRSDARHRAIVANHRSREDLADVLPGIVEPLLAGDTGGSEHALLIIRNGRRLAHLIDSFGWNGYYRANLVRQLLQLRSSTGQLPVTVVTVDTYLPPELAPDWYDSQAPAGADLLAVGPLPSLELGRQWLPVDAEHAHRMATRYESAPPQSGVLRPAAKSPFGVATYRGKLLWLPGAE